MPAEHMLGIDVGTSGCKVLIVTKNGFVRGAASKNYETYIPKTTWAEQNPADWVLAARQAVKDALRKANLKPSDLGSICVDGMSNCPVFLDRKGSVLRPAIMWMDRRRIPEKTRLMRRIRKSIPRKTANFLSPISTLSKILWTMEYERSVWRRTYNVLMPKDYIVYRLTQEWSTDFSDASGTLLSSERHGKPIWSEEVCEPVGISIRKLPAILPSMAKVGYVTKKGARETGFPEGVPVAAGCADAAADCLAAGTVNPGQRMIRLGTCGAVHLILGKLPKGLTTKYFALYHCVPDRRFIQLISPCGLAHKWFSEVFFGRQTRGDGKTTPFKSIEDWATKVPMGSEGLLFHPYVSGEHSVRGASLKGGFLGLSLTHGKAHFARAVLEGIAFSIKDCFRTIQNVVPSIEPVRLMGGGTKSFLWMRIVADVLGVEVAKPRYEGASFGASLLGGISVGYFKNYHEAVKQCVRIDQVIKPNAENNRKYERLYRAYEKSYENLSEAYDMLGEIT